MMNIETLFRLLALAAKVEVPTLHDGSSAHQAYLDGIHAMSEIYIEIGKEGAVVSPDVDPLLLAAIGYEESRHRPGVPDGDCSPLPAGPRCHAFGPMQINTSSPSWLAQLDVRWKGETVVTLREPKRNVEAAYAMLKYFAKTCHNGVPSLLGEWSAGKCLGKKPIVMGTRRCAYARAIGDAAGVEVAACSGQPGSKHMARVVKAIAQDKLAPVASPPVEPRKQ